MTAIFDDDSLSNPFELNNESKTEETIDQETTKVTKEEASPVVDEPANPDYEQNEPVNPDYEQNEPVNPKRQDEPAIPKRRKDISVISKRRKDEPVNPKREDEPVDPKRSQDEPVNPKRSQDEPVNPKRVQDEPINTTDNSVETSGLTSSASKGDVSTEDEFSRLAVADVPDDDSFYDSWNRPKRARKQIQQSQQVQLEMDSNRVVFPLEIRAFAVDQIKNGVTKVQIARELDCPVSTVSGWWNKRDQILQVLISLGFFYPGNPGWLFL